MRQSCRRRPRSLGVQERVCFVGRVPPDRAPLYYRLADVSIDPVRADEASQARSPLRLFESGRLAYRLSQVM